MKKIDKTYKLESKMAHELEDFIYCPANEPMASIATDFIYDEMEIIDTTLQYAITDIIHEFSFRNRVKKILKK